MKTSKGTIQGYNGIAAVDKAHQIIIEAQAIGASQEQHTLRPMLEGIRQRYRKSGLHDDILTTDVIVTADTGFASEKNYQDLLASGINAYIPDNQFRSRDPKFKDQKEKYGKRHQDEVKGVKEIIPANEFDFNPKDITCVCPEGNAMWLHRATPQDNGKVQMVFEGKLTDCRHCLKKDACMRNPTAANHRKGHGRLVSFMVRVRKSATDWMKRRVDSREGKRIYGHRMSTVEPVFGNICSNKGLKGFSLRGKEKVQGQWRMYCLVHNIEKIMNYGCIA